MSVDDGGAAFPHDNLEYGDMHLIASPGMSLRDYFAGQAMSVAYQVELTAPTHNGPSYQGVAERAYLMADAMLKAREGAR